MIYNKYKLLSTHLIGLWRKLKLAGFISSFPQCTVNVSNIVFLFSSSNFCLPFNSYCCLVSFGNFDQSSFKSSISIPNFTFYRLSCLFPLTFFILRSTKFNLAITFGLPLCFFCHSNLIILEICWGCHLGWSSDSLL